MIGPTCCPRPRWRRCCPAPAPGRYWVLYAALVAENSGGVLYAPAAQARTPAIVGTGPLLSSANALNSLGGGAVRLIGGPLGGFLLAPGRHHAG